MLLFVSHYHMISIEAKQFFSLIFVIFKIKLRKLCYTGSFFLVKNCILNLNKFSKRTYASQLEKPTKELVVGLSTLMSTFLNKSCNYKRVSSSWDIYELREISKKKLMKKVSTPCFFSFRLLFLPFSSSPACLF